MLKKFFAISFLFIYLVSTTELNQLLKLPVLVQHFAEHERENADINFFEFLRMHYAGKDVKDTDYEKDMKLPFKSHTNCVSVTSNFIVSLPVAFSISRLEHRTAEKTFVIKDKQLITSFLSKIWQPPRTT